LSLGIRTEGAALIVSVAGAADLLNGQKLSAAMDAACAKRPALLVVDFQATRFIDSSGITALVLAARKCERYGGVVRLVVTLDSQVHRVLVTTGMALRFGTFEGVEAAVAHGKDS
jgi:anti-anti-sigma factor